MKARMMWMGAALGVLALTGCQQRDSGARTQEQDTAEQKGDTQSGGMIPERGVQESTIGGIGGGTEAEENAATGGSGPGGAKDAGMAADAGTGGSGLEGDDSMRRTPEKDRELMEEQQQEAAPDENP